MNAVIDAWREQIMAHERDAAALRGGDAHGHGHGHAHEGHGHAHGPAATGGSRTPTARWTPTAPTTRS